MTAFTQEEIKTAIDKAHISTEEIKQDIADTEAEIEKMERERKGFLLIDGRINVFRAENRAIGINDRKKFIDKLKTILLIRESGVIENK